MAHLEWTDINWMRRQIHIQPKKDWSPKSARPRTIEINAHAMEALQEANRRNQKRIPPSLLVFPGAKRLPGGHSGWVEPCMRPGRNCACDGPSTAPYVRIPDGDERKRSPLGGGNARASGYHDDDDLCAPDTGPHQNADEQARRSRDSGNLPEICPKSSENRKREIRRKPNSPLSIAMVPKAGFEPARVSPPPPQDGVSASSTTSARCREKYSIHPPVENQYGEFGERQACSGSHPVNLLLNVFLPKPPASL